MGKALRPLKRQSRTNFAPVGVKEKFIKKGRPFRLLSAIAWDTHGTVGSPSETKEEAKEKARVAKEVLHWPHTAIRQYNGLFYLYVS